VSCHDLTNRLEDQWVLLARHVVEQWCGMERDAVAFDDGQTGQTHRGIGIGEALHQIAPATP
jgi:hypothetical protein